MSRNGRPFRFRRALLTRQRLVAPVLALGLVLVVAGAGASAAFESGTVGSFAMGLWWSISLLTTVGFVGQPPSSPVGIFASVLLMVAGFLLLSVLSAAMASLFVRDDEQVEQRREQLTDERTLTLLHDITNRLAALERHLQPQGPPTRAPHGLQAGSDARAPRSGTTEV